MNEINSFAELQALLLAGVTNWSQFGDVMAVYQDDLVLFNYTQSAQYAGRWNWFERHARGLILNHITGEIVARPFPKFYNYGERMPAAGTTIVEVCEKMDGSLGILYRQNGEYRIATRGSFTSTQALWATNYLHEMIGRQHIDDSLTLLFEIIYPENRIVVDYGQRTDLVLLAAINRFTGKEVDRAWFLEIAAHYGFPVPWTDRFTDDFESILTAAKTLSVNEEGWVIRMSDGSRFKVKGDAYKIAHKILTGVTFSRVLEAVTAGIYEDLIEGVPDEFLGQVKAWKAEIEATVRRITSYCLGAMQTAPEGDRKTFALWVQSGHPKEMHSYLFTLKDGRDIVPMIYRQAFKDRPDDKPRFVFDEPVIVEAKILRADVLALIEAMPDDRIPALVEYLRAEIGGAV